MEEFFTPENEIYARYAAIGFFAICTLILIIKEIRKHKFSKQDFFKNNSLPAASFFILLAVAVFRENVGIAATVIFVSTAVLHFACNRNFYPLHKIFYLLFLYTLLLFLGTIGTQKGFRFPDTIITFCVLPLSLCLVNISKETLHRVAKLFFRIMIVYMATCIVYWLYNYQYIDIPLSEWFTEKSDTTIFPNDFEGGGARFFVTMWSGYFHPTYISFVLFMGLITGAHLFYKGQIKSFELLLYGIFCAFVILLMQSRIAIITFPIVSVISLILYSVLTRTYTVPLLLSALIVGGASIFFTRGSTDLVKDSHRSSYYPLAIRYIERKPFWGCGYGEQRTALDEQIALDSITVKKRLNYVHNQFLGNTVQYGFTGLLILLILLFGILLYTIKWRSYPLLIFLIVLSLYMMIEEPLYVQTGITKVTMFLVFFVALTAQPNGNGKEH